MDWMPIAWAGFVAIVVSAAVFWLFRSFGLTEFSPSIQLGCLFIPNPRHPAAETAGFVLLLVLGSTVVPALYAEVFGWLQGPSWADGLALGIVHGLLAAAALPLLGMISACIRAGAVPAPGAFGIRWGWLTPLSLLIGHGLYGAVCGAILAQF